MDRRKPEDMQPWEKRVISALTLATVLFIAYIIVRVVMFVVGLIGA